ncbi:DoxX family protein [Kineococcus arenarius]|uniref:DoxX family protein n=1 Tax=Kineococcus sp. SYSU DK007 TaxID=3383128 RepID=UPI003D7D1FE8
MVLGRGAAAAVPASTARWAPLAVLFGVAGLAHLRRPGVFDAIVPRSLPGPPRAWTTASGVAELALAAGLSVPATRRAAGWAGAGFLLAVWPANGRMALDARHARGRAGALRRAVTLARLPLQVPLVRTALRVARGGPA